MPDAPTGRHTLDSLAFALKGMPRDALMLIETPDGLRPIALVSATYVADTDAGLRERPGSSGRARYAIVLHPGER